MRSPQGTDYAYLAEVQPNGQPIIHTGRVMATRNRYNYEAAVYDGRDNTTRIYDVYSEDAQDFKAWAAAAFEAKIRGTFPNYYIDED